MQNYHFLPALIW